MDQAPIKVQSGQVLVDTSVIPFIRRSDVEFIASDLLPYKAANFFFDETNVTKFVQRPSELVMTGAGTTGGDFTKKQAFINEVTGAYFTVVDYNASNTIYINDNFLTLNIYGTTLASGDFAVGDIVYQNGTATSGLSSSNTFMGKVVYWDESVAVNRGWLVLEVLSGTVNSASSVANTIFNVSGAGSGAKRVATALGTASGVRFAPGHKFIYVQNPSVYDFVSTYVNYSGQVVSANGSLSTMVLSSNVSSALALGNSEIKIVSGTGIGQIRKIDSAVNNIVTLNSAFTVAVTGDSRYSIGESVVDDYGKLSGIFNIPENPSMKFRTGERLFTITDANDYLDPDSAMKAAAKYVSSGTLNTKQEIRVTPIVIQIPTLPGEPPVQPPPPTQPEPPPTIIVPTQPARRRRRRRRDPVAQTFFTPEPNNIKQNYGIFVTSVDIFFKAKPNASSPQLPVTVRIVSTVNGYPTQDIIAAATVYPDKVKVANGTTLIPSVSNSLTKTKFTFDNPVYLAPSTEYAIVVFSESPEYEVWISELGESIIGTDRRVSEQPYAGSFFRSQNASTWTPYQNQDLMFVINKALFTDNEALLTFRTETPSANVFLDELILHSSDLKFPSTAINYAIKTTYAKTALIDTDYINVTPNEPYNFGGDLKNSSVTNNRRRVILAGNGSSSLIEVRLSSTDNAVSPIFNTERFSMVGIENYINNGSLTSNSITVVSGGGYHLSGNGGITVAIGAPQLTGGETAVGYVATSDIVNGNIKAVTITNGGFGYVESPTITITDSNVSGSPNASAVVVSEDSNFGGNAKARYITRKITLADGFDAGDIRVFLRGVRPQGTHILVYYKVLSSTDPENFYNKNWKRMTPVKDLFSPDQERTVDMLFRPDLTSGKLTYTENGVQYPLGGKFKNFAIKIVLLANDTTVVPYVKNIRVIATPEG